MTQTTEEKTEQRILDDTKRLREWLNMQPHLPHSVEDKFLRTYVVGTKGLEIAKRKLDAWFSTKHKLPDLFSLERLDPFSQLMKDSYDTTKLFVLPKLTPEGYIVQWCAKGKRFDLYDHPQNIIRAVMHVTLGLRFFPDNKGYICVYDFAEMPAWTLTKLNPALMATVFQWFIAACPLKHKKTIVVNTMTVVDTIVNVILKPLLNEKHFKRITLTSEGEKALVGIIPKEMLPEDYGGNEKHSDLLNEDCQKMMEEHASWLIETLRLMSDEKKRPADMPNNFGIEGTFRTLSID